MRAGPRAFKTIVTAHILASMTGQSLSESKRRGKLENRTDEVIAMLLDGASERDVAEHFSCSRQGVQLFKQRHVAELKGVKAALVEQVKANWIVDKAKRIAKLQWLAELTEAEITEYGITVVEERTDTDRSGETTVYKTRDYRGQLVREYRGLLKDAAIEEGQIVTPKPDGINIDKAIINIYRTTPKLGV